MKALSFELSGKTGCFRKPDVNAYAYFTYNNIHKPALLGLLGAVIGLGGYTKLHDEKLRLQAKIKEAKGKDKKLLQEEEKKLQQKMPEFYEKLEHLKVSISPMAKHRDSDTVNHGYFSKKIQTFNNSVGYASKEAGGNLVVREQWLEEPKWQIMILDDGSEAYQKVAYYLQEKKAVYIPYLGKNDHPAKIDEVKEVELSSTLYEIDDECYIDSLFIKPIEGFGFHREADDIPFVFQEVSPIKLQEQYHFYEYETLVFTNYEPKKTPKDTYCYDNKNYCFI